MEPASQRYVDDVAAAARDVLGAGTVGVYLHGSAVLGGYDAARSDLDVLVVAGRAMTAAEQHTLAASLAEAALPCPAVGLELSVITRDVALRPGPVPRFELHVTTAPLDTKVVDGHGRRGDPDLVLHAAVCRAAGLLVGPGLPVEEAFAPVPPALLLAQLDAELGWAAEHVPTAYAVLNACRARAYAADRVLLSKVAGGEWLLARPVDPMDADLVTRALARQRGEEAPPLPADEVRRFVDDVRGRWPGGPEDSPPG